MREKGAVEILTAESPDPSLCAGESVGLQFPLADPQEKGARLHLEVCGSLRSRKPIALGEWIHSGGAQVIHVPS